MTDDVTQAAAPGPAPEPAPAAAPTPAPARPARGPLGALRSLGTGVAFALTCLALVLAVTTWWIHDTVLSTDAFVEVTAPLVENPAVTDALATVTTDQVAAALDLGPIGTYVIGGITREVFASDAFAALWERALPFVHEQLVRLLRGETSRVQVIEGQLVLNLYPVIDRILERLAGLDLEIRGTTIEVPDITNPDDPAASRAELEAALGRPLSPDFGVVPIASAERLENLQRLVTIFDAFVVVLFVVTALLAVLTVALARRRLRIIALLAIGGLAALLAARLIVASVADGMRTALAEGGPGAVIGVGIVQVLETAYRDFAQWILLAALVVAVVATLVAWRLERQAAAATMADERTAAGADGWFLAFAGLCIALAALLLVGLTLATLVAVGLAYAGWLALVWLRNRRPVAVAA